MSYNRGKKVKKQEKELPKWFDASRYVSGDTVTNPFSGKSEKLTANELAMYDYIKGLEYFLCTIDWSNRQLVEKFNKGMLWFSQSNPKAYYTLLN